MLRYLALLYVARMMPFDTYSWHTTVRLHGTSFAVGVRTSEIYVVDEVYGQRMYDRSEDYMPQPGWTVVDLGANVGVFTVLAARRGATVYSFEPNPACFDRLCKNVRSNGFAGSVTTFNAALSDAAGRGWMKVERGGTTGGTVTVGGDSTVEITTLDEALAGHSCDSIDLLKLDIEGAEVQALRGATEILAKTQRAVAEYHSRALLASCEEILAANGFATDLSFVYYPEGLSDDGEEVGMFYASRELATTKA